MQQTILIIDDIPNNIKILLEILRKDYAIQVANSGKKALDILGKENKPDLILLDVNMPELSGYDVMEIINSTDELAHIPVIFVTANSGFKEEIRGLELGVADYIKKPYNPIIVKKRVENILELKAYQDSLEQKVAERTSEIYSTQLLIIKKLSTATEYNNQDTGDHIERMSRFCKVIGLMYGMSNEEAELLYSVAPMHDIGKIGISNDIVLKPGKLSINETEIMRQHCEIGKNIIGEHDSLLLKAARIVAYEHHERWDGNGYPRGIAGEDIHLFGRIAAVADVFDALLSQRSYKRAWTFTEAYNHIVEQSEGHFDPTVVEAFVRGVNQIKGIVNHYNGEIITHKK